jgi:hypothetical protein
MANKFYSQKPNVGYENIFTTKQDITNYFKINSDNYYADLYSKYKLQLEPKNSKLSVANVDLGYKIGGVDIKNYITAPYLDYTSGNHTFNVDSKFKMMSIILVGAGGSGGSGPNLNSNYSGYWSDYGAIGGSGAVYISDYIINSSTDSYSVTIGQGGASVKQTSYIYDGVDGNSGGSTRFTNTTKGWYINAGGGGGGGRGWYSSRSSNVGTSPGSGGTNWDSGTTTNFTNNYKYTGLGDGTTNIGGYWRCSQLTQDNINNYPTLYKINGSSAEYGNAGNGGAKSENDGSGLYNASESGQPGFCRIYFK